LRSPWGRFPSGSSDHGWHDVTELPELGSVEIWRFINDSGVSRPIHMHLLGFQFLDRDGFTNGPGGEMIPNGNPQVPAGEEREWKDTALRLRVSGAFERPLGPRPSCRNVHCRT
jgi:FtsP/CotA-like multicopper oxidase with cupredoxin domain